MNIQRRLAFVISGLADSEPSTALRYLDGKPIRRVGDVRERLAAAEEQARALLGMPKAQNEANPGQPLSA